MRWLFVTLAFALVPGCSGAAARDDVEGQTRAPFAAPRALPFVSPEQARRVRLTRRLPSAYRAVCAEQAAYAPAEARTCPPLVPAGPLDVLAATPFSQRAKYRGGYLADLASTSLGELWGKRVNTNGGHWHYDVSWTPTVTRLQVDGVVRPVNARRTSVCRLTRLGDHRVEACHVVPYEDGGGLNGGHVAYIWSSGRTTFVISLHGYRNEPRARAMMAGLIRELASARDLGTMRDDRRRERAREM